MANLERIRGSVAVRGAIVALLIVALAIPLAFIDNLVSERQAQRYYAVEEISRSWGGAQTLGVPVLVIPYTKAVTLSDSKQIAYRSGFQYVLAEQARIEASASVEKRYRGIHEVPVYRTTVSAKGDFNSIEELLPKSATLEYQWSEARLIMPLTNVRGIHEIATLSVNGKSYQPSLSTHQSLKLSGLEVELPISPGSEALNFDWQITVDGTESLSFYPLANSTQVVLGSAWPSPSFSGNFLPDNREIDETGFIADWSVMAINHGLGLTFSDTQLDHSRLVASQFGVNIYQSGDTYLATDRVLKYSLLVICLSFAAFFIAEMLLKLRLRAPHYLLVGAAMLTFYLLLLSLSEHLMFGLAYLVAALATAGVIGGYCMAILGQPRRGIYAGLGFLGLYGCIYVLLRAEDYALLLGAIMIWLVVALMMYLTRRIRWNSADIAEP